MEKKMPILDHDDQTEAMIEPSHHIRKTSHSPLILLCFFNDVLKKMHEEKNIHIVDYLKSETGKNPIYEGRFFNTRVTLVHPGVGAPLAGATMEELIAKGGHTFLAVGGAGVLDQQLIVGSLMIPYTAIRDEGLSYHYLKPEPEIHLNSSMVKHLEAFLSQKKLPFSRVKTWTTDAFYRETKGTVLKRKAAGALCVDMECSALAAVAQFRNVVFGQILYSGDCLAGEIWDSREWTTKEDIRENLVMIGIEALVRMDDAY